MINFNFRYHNVGQGLFYSGEFNFKERKFHFVYDCGSENNTQIKECISLYKRNHFSRKQDKFILDLLIISHFHRDHINGLKDLLKNTEIKTVIIPYLNPIKLLTVYLENPEQPEWYYDFIINPVNYLFENGVKRIILISGEEGKDEGPTGGGDSFKPEDSDYGFYINPDDLENDMELKKRIVEDGYDDWLERIQTENNNNDGLFLKKYSSLYLYASFPINGQMNKRKSKSKFWKFKFFNKEFEDIKLNDFQVCIDSLMKRSNIKNVQLLLQKINDNDLFFKLKKCYENLNTDLNLTSLVVMHSSIPSKCRFNIYKLSENIRKLYPIHFFRYKKCPFLQNRRYFNIDDYFEFLTGDMSFKKTCLKEITNYYKNDIENIKIFLISHHGAASSWNSDVLQKLLQPLVFTVSAGIVNKYDHPRISVVDDVISNGNILLWSNERNRIQIIGGVYCI